MLVFLKRVFLILRKDISRRIKAFDVTFSGLHGLKELMAMSVEICDRILRI